MRPLARTGAADADNHWRRSLGYLLAEQGQIADAIALFERIEDDEFVDDFLTVETWLNDNIPVPGEVFRQFFAESAWLAAIGSLAGVLVGVLGVDEQQVGERDATAHAVGGRAGAETRRVAAG